MTANKQDGGGEVAIVNLPPNDCPHGANLNISVCHRCDGTAIYTEEQVRRRELEARIDELRQLGHYSMRPIGVVRGRHERSYEDRIAQLQASAEGGEEGVG